MSREFEVAFGVVREGAAMARVIQEATHGRSVLKADESPVTVADFAVQALIAHRLAAAFPDDPIVAEEDAEYLRTAEGRPTLSSVLDALARAGLDLTADGALAAIDRGRGDPAGRFWTLDPIDGTQGFLRQGQYAVALALIVQGRVEIGILGCPSLPPSATETSPPGTVVCAVRGRGAWRAPLTRGPLTGLHVSPVQEARAARVLRSVESAHIDLRAFDRIIQRLGVEVPPEAMDSQAKHAVIAAGDAELLLRLPARSDYQEKIWDQAAGALIVEEAGGRVTDLRGRPLDFGAGRWLAHNQGVVTSNGHLHEAAIDAVRGPA